MTNMKQRQESLEAKLEELTSRAKEIDDDLKEVADDDWAENANEAADDEVLEEVGDVTLEEIRQVKLALSRIENGTYGTCARCGETIPEQRLSAIPHATRCIKCA